MNKLSIDNHYINAKVQYKKFFSQRDITIDDSAVSVPHVAL